MGFGGDVTADNADDKLTLRDRFAIAALQGLVCDWTTTAEDHAKTAYEYADAMMAVRSII